SLLSEPLPASADRIQEDGEKHRKSEVTEVQTNRSTGPERRMFCGEGTLQWIQPVVIESVCCERQQQEGENDVSPTKKDTMRSLGIAFDSYRSRGNTMGTHWVFTDSSVETENC